uniref:Uncharacterized protein n=1 Tax=Graphocephala atropunctata TaxID=36148 RepID=A0A1B6LBG6_9HEMI
MVKVLLGDLVTALHSLDRRDGTTRTELKRFFAYKLGRVNTAAITRRLATAVTEGLVHVKRRRYYLENLVQLGKIVQTRRNPRRPRKKKNPPCPCSSRTRITRDERMLRRRRRSIMRQRSRKYHLRQLRRTRSVSRRRRRARSIGHDQGKPEDANKQENTNAHPETQISTLEEDPVIIVNVSKSGDLIEDELSCTN